MFLMIVAVPMVIFWPRLANMILRNVSLEIFYSVWTPELMNFGLKNGNVEKKQQKFQELKMEKGTMLFETWMKLPVPIYMTFWMFNWTNSQDIRLPNYKPNLVELGPYVFLEKHMRENVTFHPDRDSLSFDQVRTWHFRPELSNGSLDDMVTNVNVMAAVSVSFVFFSFDSMKFVHFGNSLFGIDKSNFAKFENEKNKGGC